MQDALCDPRCGVSLANYHSDVSSACASDVQPFDGLPATYFGDVAAATYNLTCLTDSSTGEYCTDVIFDAFANYTTDSDGTGLPASDLCSSCVVSAFRQIQSTPYSNYGAQLVDQWSSIQETCSLDYPTAVQPLQTNVTNLPGYSNLNTTELPSCLSGNTYTVASGDTCTAISVSQNISTGALISINQVLPDCSNLDIGQVLCLPQTCQTYVVQSGDSCVSIANTYDLLLPEILSWNPALNNCKSDLFLRRDNAVLMKLRLHKLDLWPEHLHQFSRRNMDRHDNCRSHCHTDWHLCNCNSCTSRGCGSW